MCVYCWIVLRPETFLLTFFKDGCIRFHRADFLDIFIKSLPEGVAHFHKRVESYVQDTSNGLIQLCFHDNTSATCDILVGCDGIKSTIRAEMLRSLASKTGRREILEAVEPSFSGTIAYRGLIPVNNMPLNAEGKPHRTIQSPMMVSLLLPSLCVCVTILFFGSIAVKAKFVGSTVFKMK